jgi:putative hemolysin
MPPILPRALQTWAEPLTAALQRLLIPDEVIEGFEIARQSGTGAKFAARLLECMDIRFTIRDGDLARIPTRGPSILVANHPYGIVEGLILMVALERIRPDFKLLANSWLGWIEELRHQLILVNPFDSCAARADNRAPLRTAIASLAEGNLLAVFPAGEVAHVDWKERSITDPAWKTTGARLALRVRCPVVPAFFEGANSLPFQVVGLLHAGLRTVSLAREFFKMRGKTIRLHIGSAIPYATLARYSDAMNATAYMRHRTFFLANRSKPTTIAARRDAQVPVILQPGTVRRLSEEVAGLPAECELTGDRDFSVYLVRTPQIFWMLKEIGRCRELTFRAAGEGSGVEADLDHYDQYYQHLFLWHKADRRLAGAYRLAVTSDVLPKFGISGLYTSTLFRYHPSFFERTGPAVELGRSFVIPEYQRNYAALLLLWKGITRAVRRRPEAPALFGAVSISADYSKVSRTLMAAYLSGRVAHELAQLVAPRSRFHSMAAGDSQIGQFAAATANIEDLSSSIADIELDGKGVPVLVRQYLKAGGRVLGFHVDANFSSTLDALMLADLRMAPQALLERCMGRSEAHAFLRDHGRPLVTSGSK